LANGLTAAAPTSPAPSQASVRTPGSLSLILAISWFTAFLSAVAAVVPTARTAFLDCVIDMFDTPS